MNNETKLQGALHHSPGKLSSVLIFKEKEGQDSSDSRLIVSRLLKLIEAPNSLPKNLHIMVAVNPAIISEELDEATYSLPKLFPRGSKNRLMPDTQEDVLVQIAASCRTHWLFASRLVIDCLESRFDCVVEHSGGNILFGQEPFGFTHGKSEEALYLQDTATITSAPLVGGTWLLYQCYIQDLTRFFQGVDPSDIKEQKEIIGAQHARSSFRAHSDAMKSARRSHKHIVSTSRDEKLSRPYLVRRGFAHRRDGEEGTIFLAVSKKPEVFVDTLDKMIAKDLMLDFTTAIEGGIYFVPPSGEWLSQDAKPAKLPPSAQMLNLALEKNKLGKSHIELEDYETVASFIEFIKALRYRETLFEGVIGDQEINPDISALLEAMYKVLSGGELTALPSINEENLDTEYVNKLKNLQTQLVEDSNQLNQEAGRYMTVV